MNLAKQHFLPIHMLDERTDSFVEVNDSRGESSYFIHYTQTPALMVFVFGVAAELEGNPEDECVQEVGGVCSLSASAPSASLWFCRTLRKRQC